MVAAKCFLRNLGGSFFSLLYLEREVVRLLHNWSMDYSLCIVFSLVLMEANLSEIRLGTPCTYCGNGEANSSPLS